MNSGPGSACDTNPKLAAPRGGEGGGSPPGGRRGPEPIVCAPLPAAGGRGGAGLPSRPPTAGPCPPGPSCRPAGPGPGRGEAEGPRCPRAARKGGREKRSGEFRPPSRGSPRPGTSPQTFRASLPGGGGPAGSFPSAPLAAQRPPAPRHRRPPPPRAPGSSLHLPALSRRPAPSSSALCAGPARALSHKGEGAAGAPPLLSARVGGRGAGGRARPCPAAPLHTAPRRPRGAAGAARARAGLRRPRLVRASPGSRGGGRCEAEAKGRNANGSGIAARPPSSRAT